MYTPLAFPGSPSGKVRTQSLFGCPVSDPQTEIVVTLKEDGKDGDDRRRFKVQFALANVIDLNSLSEFCRGEKQNEKTKETMVS
jgi:hypothetical protein